MEDLLGNPEDRFSRVAAQMSNNKENWLSANAKTKMQISCAVTVQLISTFVFNVQIAHSLFFNFKL